MTSLNSRISFKGSSIYDLLYTLRTLAESEEKVFQNIVEDPMENHKSYEYQLEEITNLGILLKAKNRKLAYYKVIDFIEMEFIGNKYEMEINDFKQKTFRGNKLENLINFLDLEILYCKRARRDFKRSEIEILKFLSKKSNGAQLKVYKQVKRAIQEIFFDNRKGRKEHLTIWTFNNMDSHGELDESEEESEDLNEDKWRFGYEELQ